MPSKRNSEKGLDGKDNSLKRKGSIMVRPFLLIIFFFVYDVSRPVESYTSLSFGWFWQRFVCGTVFEFKEIAVVDTACCPATAHGFLFFLRFGDGCT